MLQTSVFEETGRTRQEVQRLEVRYISEAYAAPEVVAKDPRSTSADIWSLGCVYLDMIVSNRQ